MCTEIITPNAIVVIVKPITIPNTIIFLLVTTLKLPYIKLLKVWLFNDNCSKIYVVIIIPLPLPLLAGSSSGNVKMPTAARMLHSGTYMQARIRPCFFGGSSNLQLTACHVALKCLKHGKSLEVSKFLGMDQNHYRPYIYTINVGWIHH